MNVGVESTTTLAVSMHSKSMLGHKTLDTNHIETLKANTFSKIAFMSKHDSTVKGWIG